MQLPSLLNEGDNITIPFKLHLYLVQSVNQCCLLTAQVSTLTTQLREAETKMEEAIQSANTWCNRNKQREEAAARTQQETTEQHKKHQLERGKRQDEENKRKKEMQRDQMGFLICLIVMSCLLSFAIGYYRFKDWNQSVAIGLVLGLLGASELLILYVIHSSSFDATEMLIHF
jgi:type III secretory pathway component EscR